MSHRFWLFLTLLAWSLSFSLPAFTQSITVEEAIKNAIEKNRALKQSDLRVASSVLREAEVLESTRPSLSFFSDPTYGLVTQRIPGIVSPLLPIAEGPSTLIINSTSAGVSLTQPLPTTGVVSGSLSGGFSISTDLPDDGDASSTFSFEPAISVAISQPLFVDGVFIDTEQPQLAYQQAQRTTRELGISGDLIRRGTMASVVALYTQLGTLRRASALQSAQQALLVGQLERLGIRRISGQASRQEELALQVQINRLDDLRLQSSLAINELELELTNITGLPFGPETELEAVDELSARVENSLAAAVAAVTLEKRASDEALARAETTLRLARKQSKATASAALSLTPRYADKRESEEQLWGSIADYFGEGAGVNVALSLGITVPLGESAARERAIRQAEIAVDLAREDVHRAAEDAENQQRLFELRIKNLIDRIELLKFELAFEESQLETELELVELGVSTEADVDTIRSDILTANIEIADLGAQLFLTRMDLADARGLDLAAVIAAVD